MKAYFTGTLAREVRRCFFQEIALLGHARQLPLQPSVPGLMVNLRRLRHRITEQLQPLVQ